MKYNASEPQMNSVENILLPAVTVRNGDIITCNDVFTELLGFSLSDIVGTQLQALLTVEDQANQVELNLEVFLSDAALSENGVYIMGALQNRHHYALPVKVYCRAMADESQALCFRVLENKSIDPITNLPNGWAIKSQGKYLFNTPDNVFGNLVLFVVSVDNFSSINFRYGFEVGDNYLCALGDRLQETVQGHGLVVRYSNAEYGILVENHNGLSAEAFNAFIIQLCQTLCNLTATPLLLESGVKVIKTFSIGLSSPHARYENYFAMEIAAETAMREAQKCSYSSYCFATDQITADLLANKLIIDELPHAIEQHQFNIYYEPQYDLNNGALVGFEALSRWRHKELGYVAPEVFVGIAEDIGLHFQFDLWVFTQVCSQVAAWQQQGLNTPRIAINISFKTLEMRAFVSRISDIIKQTNCPTALIEIEITETTSVSNMQAVTDNILEVKKMGINFAVDDFGSGYSSLSLIRAFHLSFTKLKLDRSLIENICNSTLDKEFARQIIGLGKVLEVKVLAEGVETLEQRDLLQELGCDYAQGYYFNKALSKEVAEQLIVKSNS
ncbi:MAG: diguanylate cyclase (GGDEF)-like protein [Paraglaciecola sp.]|jgi:diguanylate cyclase (GGDEF)-like protein